MIANSFSFEHEKRGVKSLEFLRQIKAAIGLFAVVLGTGVIGYVLIEGWSFEEALYMTVITVSTVGFSEVRPLSVEGEYFTIILILAGTGTAFYLLFSLTGFAVEGHLRGLLAERRVERKVGKMENHYIVCGYGKVGENAAKEFAQSKKPFVVIDSNVDRAQECRDLGYLCIAGDPSDDETLQKAGIEKAKGLIAAVEDDADNVFITLSARVLNPDIIIVAQSILEESIEKLMRAGANKVVSPSLIGGKRMAAMLLKPLVTDFLDVVSFGEGLEFRLDEFLLSPQSPLKGITIGEAEVKKRTGAVILAIRKKTGKLNTAPSGETMLEEGDELVAFGTQEQLEALQKVA